ncbi:MAG: FxDxF family PEP-CTERM protein [Rhodoferax sp.]|uniref:FxDxF family PEP-CTERM protein n=1 Tax=Rhodoferax sp. TaxID=50421 RepID=UPI00271B35C5|nr:FxDxF family PEP-CTERM protein [Rhodoferax sp.]MDO8447177.1 FxDxF family PEP-CTERM protein [Rhodoferax sp.]
MKTQFKPLLAALLLVGLASAAQAAYFERVDYLAAGGYSATTNGAAVSDAAMDLSAQSGDVAVFGANVFDTSLTNGSLTHSYVADAYLTFSAGSTDLSMSLSHSLGATTSDAMTVASHQQDAFIDMTAVTLKIVGQAGETNGSAVNVSFAGNASALYDLNSMVNGGYLGLGLSVSRGTDVVGEYLWDVQQSGDRAVSFSFAGIVGEDLTFSSYMLTGSSLANASFAQSTSAFALAEAGASLNGSFTIAAVPEPETYAMLLAGLGFVGFMARRCRSA